MKFNFLPRAYKWVGLALIILSGILYFLFDRFAIRLDVPVFAVVSSFMETRFLVFSRTNFTDELTLLLALSGIILISFSKGKVESDELKLLRYISFTKAALYNSIFLILCILFVYGSGFIEILVLNLFSGYFIYLIIHYLESRKYKRN